MGFEMTSSPGDQRPGVGCKGNSVAEIARNGKEKGIKRAGLKVVKGVRGVRGARFHVRSEWKEEKGRIK